MVTTGMRYGSVCSGIEAATVAWESLGWRPAWFAEIDRFASAVLAHHYPQTPNLGDMQEITNGHADPIDLLVGGTPCQSFSVAGLRKGLADGRGNLAIHYCRLALQRRPRWVVWENVPGVFSSGDGRDFACFLSGLTGLDIAEPPDGRWRNSGIIAGAPDHFGVAWRTLDAQYFGVPQRRRRVFVVGHLGDWRPAAAALLEPHCMQGHPAPRRKTGQGAAAGADGGAGGGGGAEGSVAAADAVERGNQTGGVPFLAFSCKDSGQDAGDTAPTLRAMGGRTGVNPNAGGQIAVAVDLQNASLGQGDVSGTLDTTRPGRGGGQALMTAMAVRRLSVVECERLQGFPDDYTLIPWRTWQEAERKGVSYEGLLAQRGMRLREPAGMDCPDGPRYRALGNSMAVPVMHWIGRRIQMVEDVVHAYACKGE